MKHKTKLNKTLNTLHQSQISNFLNLLAANKLKAIKKMEE